MNFYPTAKAIVDGLVEYGLLPDDSNQYLEGPFLTAGKRVSSPTGRGTIRCVGRTPDL